MGGVVKSVGNVLGFNNGTFFDGQRGTIEDPTKLAAFNIARPTLELSNERARELINSTFANPAFSGQRVAGLNPFRAGGANAVAAFNQGSVFPSLGGLYGGAQGLAQSGFNFGNNAQSIFDRASMDPTQQILDTASQFANNPFVDGMIDASGRDVIRQLSEQTLPSLNRSFSRTGNTNSTRAGVESAIAERGAADRLADLSSELRGRFFNQGLTLGQNQVNQNLRNMLGANEGLLQSFNAGFSGLNNAQNLGAGAFDAMNTAGGIFQNQEQNELDAQRAQFDEALKNRLAVLGMGSNVAQGAQGFGSSVGTYQNKSGAEKLGSILKLGGQIGGMFG